MAFLSPIFFIFLAGTAHASDAADESLIPPCRRSNMQSVMRPYLNYTRGSFILIYQPARKAQAGYPTVVYLPGGPGDSSIFRQVIADSIPEEFGVILTDPRGTGCNYLNQLNADEYTTDLLADDILAILKQEKLSPEQVILYGHSYGTLLATTVAQQNAFTGGKAFAQVVLEGTLGYTKVEDENLNNYIQAFANYKKNVDPHISKKLEAAVPKETKNRSKVIGSLVLQALMMGPLDSGEHALSLLARRQMEDFIRITSRQVHAAGNKPTTNRTLYNEIWCHELSDESKGSKELYFENGALGMRLVKHPICTDIVPDRPINLREKQMRESIVYLQGSEDPATPMDQARQHFQSQVSAASKTFITFVGLSHEPTRTISQSNRDLLKDLWRNGFEKRHVLEAFEKTRYRVSVESTSGDGATKF